GDRRGGGQRPGGGQRQGGGGQRQGSGGGDPAPKRPGFGKAKDAGERPKPKPAAPKPAAPKAAPHPQKISDSTDAADTPDAGGSQS
ncbi:MAG: hypothetical protein ACR2OC_11520, partial [Solirubrobacterales bacterium]